MSLDSSMDPAGLKNQRTIDTELTVSSWIYDMVIWVFMVIFDMFFREILPRGSYRIPRTGAVILVGAPHSNQFVDAMILMRLVRNEVGRRISFLIAESSMKRRFVGTMSRATGSIGVTRAQDILTAGTGKIYMDFDKDPLVLKGIGTKFIKECEVGGLIGLPSLAGNGEIKEIVNDEEIILRKEIKKNPKIIALLDRKAGGTIYKRAPHVDQTQMYHRVFDHLNNGGCLGIFPEGGSHDRPELLPLKAGVAIMALGTLAKYPDCNIKIVPCGMNYFHPHKFRSRAVIEFGTPLEIDPQMVEQYKLGGDSKRQAVKQVLDLITNSLKTVTVTAPDFETLMAIQAARRLYKPSGKKLPLPVVVDLNRKLLIGYNHYKDNPRIVYLKTQVAQYNRKLHDLGLRDHQVETANMSPQRVIIKLVYRSIKLLILFFCSLPGLVLFAPVFVATKKISQKRAAEGLRNSTVKIQGRDLLATWKLLVAMVAAPLLYTVYAGLATWIIWRYELIPNAGFKTLALVMMASYIILPSVTYAALIFGETGMDIFKSLRPLALALNPTTKNTVEQLKATRRELVVEITETINTLGPQLFSDFDQVALKKQQQQQRKEAINDYMMTNNNNDDESNEEGATAVDRKRRDSNVSVGSSIESNAISRVNSESDLANMPLFSSEDYGSSATSSNLSSNRQSYQSLNIISATTTSQKIFQTEISKRIREAIAEKRRLQGEEEDADDEGED